MKNNYQRIGIKFVIIFTALFFHVLSLFSRDNPKYAGTKIESEDLAQYDYFGWSVDIDGEYIIVGAYGETTDGIRAGAAYIFKLEESVWVQKAKLRSNEPEANDLFGRAVAIHGDVVAVSARNREVVYIFEKPASGEWKDTTETAALTASSLQYNAYFGDAIDIFENYVIVGDWGHADAFIYEKPNGGWTNMTETQKIDHSSPFGGLGYSVAIDSNFAVIGAYSGIVGASICGNALVYKKEDSWVIYDTLAANDPESSDMFGSSVAIYDERIAVGAQQKNAAYVFYHNGDGWEQEAKLEPTIPVGNIDFGSGIDIEGDTILVGAYYDYTNGTGSGSALVFCKENDLWTQRSRIFATDAQEGGLFGKSVALSGDLAIVGAYGDNGDSINMGAAYIYTDYTVPLTVDDSPLYISGQYQLYQNYPNPFNPLTTISFNLFRSGNVRLEVFNILGEKVKTLINGKMCVGFQQATWDGTDESGENVASGVYIYRLKSVDGQQQRKMMLIR